jgi:hypothetical protein
VGDFIVALYCCVLLYRTVYWTWSGMTSRTTWAHAPSWTQQTRFCCRWGQGLCTPAVLLLLVARGTTLPFCTAECV